MRAPFSKWRGRDGFRNGSTRWLHQEGSLTAFVAVVSTSLFLLIGLVVDAGRAVAARSVAMDEAQQAARAGAGHLSVPALRSGQVQIDPAAAIGAANAYLSSVGQSGTASVVGQTVTVHIVSQEPTVILGIVGINEIHVSVTAQAINVHGVTRED
ncbi:MAG TPA: pilus assembly protein TadG-related protein [Acidimicrobiales bacterium]|nr:pilus assembly protein TadG-related protein [Acidimicrobiales bacterium]